MPGNVNTEIIALESAPSFKRALSRAEAILREGGLVAIPTETVYGLAADALNAEAVGRIFATKGRPSQNPVIVHVASLALAQSCVKVWPEEASRLSGAFWPGPLTIVLPKSAIIPDIVTAGGATVGIRWPSHPFVQGLIQRCRFPLAAPSANPSGALSPTNASHVAKALGGRVPLIIDGGQAQVGIESTVVDLSSGALTVLRPGIIGIPALEAALGRALRHETRTAPGQELRSPGLLEKHYAPKTKLVIWRWSGESELERLIKAAGFRPGRCHVIAYRAIPLRPHFSGVSVIPEDPEAYARALYSELHLCDERGVDLIIVEALPDTADWAALTDRLRRASIE